MKFCFFKKKLGLKESAILLIFISYRYNIINIVLLVII